MKAFESAKWSRKESKRYSKRPYTFIFEDFLFENTIKFKWVGLIDFNMRTVYFQ